MVELDLHKLIKKALSAARSAYDNKQHDRAASAYDKAANWMSMYAEQAIGRDAEQRRKKKSIEYREMAKRLRAGEDGSEDTNTDGKKESTNNATDAESPIKSIVSSLMHHSSMGWDDIGGLNETKAEIKFALGMSVAKPPKKVKIKAWTKMLFYGPPGTGKTLLAAATSNALTTTGGVPSVFYNVKMANILSKFFGESSKIISELYGTARDTSPSVVFLDEFESIAGRRGGDGESGAERRIMSTLLSELDGMDEKGRHDIYVLTIAATNRPWDLDPAVLSRFEKKILIPLPDAQSRDAILRIHLDRRGFDVLPDYMELVEMTEGYSGREIERFCKEVTTSMIEEVNREIPALVDKGLDKVKNHQLQVRALGKKDFEDARKLIHPQTSPEEMQRYRDWKESSEDS